MEDEQHRYCGDEEGDQKVPRLPHRRAARGNKGGEGDHGRQLGEFRGLDGRDPEVEPSARTQDLDADAGN